MVFSSSIFIFGFLPIVLITYFLVPKCMKNTILLLSSIVFYIFGGIKFLFLLMLTVFISYISGILISKNKNKKFWLIFGITLNLIFLFYFKYCNFFINNINNIFDVNFNIRNIILPIGISFYTFQSLSYIIDVYRKGVDVQKNYFTLLLYISFFPQLIAGPIVRYSDVENEIKKRTYSIDAFSNGVERFILGFAKKIILANQTGKLADIIFSSSQLNTPCAWLGAIAYMMQIYFDFSAYSDMAIGLAKIFGFNFPENFNFPYISKSITEFWRRWHISLSSFFRDYVYIPLGGNKKGIIKTIRNMLIVWLLTGFWHGASWNFILWGLYYFIFLVLEKYVLKKILDKTPKFLRHIITLFIILIGWVLFRCDNLDTFIYYIKIMFSFNINSIALSELRIYLETYFVYLIGGIIFSTPIYYVICDKFKNSLVFNVVKYIGLIILFVVSILFLSNATYNPFIYFRF